MPFLEAFRLNISFLVDVDVNNASFHIFATTKFGASAAILDAVTSSQCPAVIRTIFMPTQNVRKMSESSTGVVNPSSIEITENINGILSPNGTHHLDETDQAASRQRPRKYHQIESQRVHIIWDIFAVASILTFVADVTSDIVVSVLYYIDGSYLWFSLTLGFVLLSSIVMQVFSAKWFREDDEDQSLCTYLLHIFLMGPLVR